MPYNLPARILGVYISSAHSVYLKITNGSIKQESLTVTLFENEGKEMLNKIKLPRIIHILIPYSMLTMANKFLVDTISQNMHSNILQQHKLRL